MKKLQATGLAVVDFFVDLINEVFSLSETKKTAVGQYANSMYWYHETPCGDEVGRYRKEINRALEKLAPISENFQFALDVLVAMRKFGEWSGFHVEATVAESYVELTINETQAIFASGYILPVGCSIEVSKEMTKIVISFPQAVEG